MEVLDFALHFLSHLLTTPCQFEVRTYKRVLADIALTKKYTDALVSKLYTLYLQIRLLLIPHNQSSKQITSDQHQRLVCLFYQVSVTSVICCLSDNS